MNRHDRRRRRRHIARGKRIADIERHGSARACGSEGGQRGERRQGSWRSRFANFEERRRGESGIDGRRGRAKNCSNTRRHCNRGGRDGWRCGTELLLLLPRAMRRSGRRLNASGRCSHERRRRRRNTTAHTRQANERGCRWVSSDQNSSSISVV